MDEERLSELEGWTLEDRAELTLSETVLLEGIAEICSALRDSWDSIQRCRREEHSHRAELEKDRRMMEGVDLELTLGGDDAANNARQLLGERIVQLSEIMEGPKSSTSEETLPASEWNAVRDET